MLQPVGEWADLCMQWAIEWKVKYPNPRDAEDCPAKVEHRRGQLSDMPHSLMKTHKEHPNTSECS